MNEIGSLMHTLIERIRVATEKASLLYVPISGGSDSALTFWLLNQSKPGKVIGLHAQRYAGARTYLPEADEKIPDLRCRDWFETQGEIQEVMISGADEEREELMWARFLGAALGRKGTKRGWLVGCRNRTEQVLGTYSLASRVATFLPIVNLWKTEVLKLCEVVGVPNEIIASSKRADPKCGRPESMAEISFDVIDIFCKYMLDHKPLHLHSMTAEEKEYLSSVYEKNSFKSHLPTEIV